MDIIFIQLVLACLTGSINIARGKNQVISFMISGIIIALSLVLPWRLVGAKKMP